MYFLGIDGGGTKTTAAVCDENGTRIARVTGDTINYYSIPFEQARQNLKETVDAVCKKAGCKHFDSAFIGLSALAGRADDETTAAFTDGIINSAHIVMDSDIYIALYAAKSSGSAAVAISGTGSMVAGRLENGSVITKGGYGFLLGDEGSAYAIALAGVKAAMAAYSGAEKPTELTKRLFDFFNASTLDELITAVYSPVISRSRLASFAPEVTCAASAGDETALFVLKEQARQLSGTVLSLMKKLPGGTPLHVYGGVFQHDEIFRHFFEDYLSAYGTPVLPLPISPADGALAAARAEIQ